MTAASTTRPKRKKHGVDFADMSAAGDLAGIKASLRVAELISAMDPQAVIAALEGGRSSSTISAGVADLPDDFDIDRMNAIFCVVLMGGSGVVVMEAPAATAHHERFRILKTDAFKLLLENRLVTVKGRDGKERDVSHATLFLKAKERRTYTGLTFYPSSTGESAQPGLLNLWQGFSVEARRGGKYTIFKDHLLNNVAHGDEQIFRWIFGWFAQMLQRPRDKPGTSIVLRGAMGAGKTKIGEVFGSFIRAHYFLVDDPRYVTGNFNSHMASCLLLQAEEAVWAGDKAAEGRLKGLITSDFQMIEAKGVDSVRMPNFMRVLMTSNEDWVVPAGKDERRFAVFDVHPRCAQNHGYFAEMDEELAAGGREALLFDLLAFDLSQVNLRTIPKTEALLEQKMRSLDPIETWLLDRLKAGTPTRKHDAWPEFVEAERWFDDYVEASERIGIKRKAAHTQFGMKLRKLLPELRKDRRSIAIGDGAVVQRINIYWLPTLEDAREAFGEQLGQPMDWGTSHE